jgi:RpiB/LacA/LacB family sugar-phosphate isomerase
MRIALAADHAGLPLRGVAASTVTEAGHEAILVGPDSGEPVDYPDVALELCRALVDGQAERGILICGSGAGATIAANKVRGIRAALAHDHYTAHQMVEHDDANVLTMGAMVLGVAPAKEIVQAFVGASFTGEERHVRRLQKVLEIEAHGGEAP